MVENKNGMVVVDTMAGGYEQTPQSGKRTGTSTSIGFDY